MSIFIHGHKKKSTKKNGNKKTIILNLLVKEKRH